ncbi:hypothetical protein JL722_12712 [Aureococcus anophagefferens]|nr:hypothetical protein JL722_12712 [Aureococcus anophagefferens]
MHLLRLLGVPYVVAPMEAEAQCAALEAAGLCEASSPTTPAPSAGARALHIFDDRKYVEAYYASDCARDLRLGRDEFCALALLLGGDYDNGVAGVGVVNAMEVLQAFHFVEAGEPRDVAATLKRFKAWLDGGDGWADDGARLRALAPRRPRRPGGSAAPPAGAGAATKRRRRTRRAQGRRSAYIFFGNARRGQEPRTSLGDVGRELGARWKALSDDDKKPYAALATADAGATARWRPTRPRASRAGRRGEDEEDEEEAEAAEPRAVEARRGRGRRPLAEAGGPDDRSRKI